MQEYENMLEKAQITLEQAENIAKELDVYKENIDGYTPETPEESKMVVANTRINPETGEAVVMSTRELNEDDDKDLDEKLSELIKDKDLKENLNKPIDEEEFNEKLKDETGTLLKDAIDNANLDFTAEEIHTIITVANKRMNREKCNLYKELPERAQKMIDGIMNELYPGAAVNRNIAVNQVRNEITENIIDNFIDSIKIDRANNDFAHELANLYSSSAKELAESSIEMIEERNKKYREAIEKEEDVEKRERALKILDKIEETRTLNDLKEYAKKCKIKKIELEKANNRVYDVFLAKYKNSSNNIYSISLAKSAIMRNVPDITEIEADLFLISFCKQVQNYNINDVFDHAYMYYVLYYCVMLDGDKSDMFKNNIREVIDILVERNKSLLK